MYLAEGIPDQIKSLFDNKIIRFFLVSGLNTAFGYGLFALLIFVGIAYPISSFISTISGILFNFKTTGLIVFKNKKNSLIFRFLGVYAITYLCNVGGLTIFNMLGLSYYLGGAILLFPVGVLGFYLQKTFVFKKD